MQSSMSTERDQGNSAQRRYFHLPELTCDPWDRCTTAVRAYDTSLCRTWKEDIDTLLIFTGLFAAIVTAFTIESYKWLQPDPLETNNQLLACISRLMKNATTTSDCEPSSRSFVPDPSSLHINCFWFTSICLSLLSALVGIVCEQWVREFQIDTSASHEEKLAFRQMRFHSLHYWKVQQIIQVLPVLLQIAVLLFLTGLLYLLWSKLQITSIAIPATVVIALAILFAVGTTLLPVIELSLTPQVPSSNQREFRPFCAYKSPQSWLVYRTVSSLSAAVFSCLSTFYPKSEGAWCRNGFLTDALSTWSDAERVWLQRPTLSEIDLVLHYQAAGLRWVFQNLSFETKIARSVVYCIQDMLNRKLDNGFSNQFAGLTAASGDVKHALLERLDAHSIGADSPCRLELSLYAGTPRLPDLCLTDHLHPHVQDDLWHFIESETNRKGLTDSTAAIILVVALKHLLCESRVYELATKLRRWVDDGQVYEWHLTQRALECISEVFRSCNSYQQPFVDIYQSIISHYLLSRPHAYRAGKDYVPDLIHLIDNKLNVESDSDTRGYLPAQT